MPTERDRLAAFRSRFGIETDPEASARFRQRVAHAANESLVEIDYRARYRLEKEFAFRNGSKLMTGTTIMGDPRIAHGILEELVSSESFSTIVERAQHLLWSFEACGYQLASSRNPGSNFMTRIDQAIQLSPGVDLRLINVDNSYELAPAGVPMLDETVDHSLQWLSRFPDVHKEYRQALTILAEKKAEQYRQAQDSLRFGLEKLLKLLLLNTLPLESQGKPLKEWLSNHGVHEDVRDTAVQILGILTKQYQNAAVKHDNTVADGALKSWNGFEVEYMIYQYTTLIRLLMEAAASRSAA